MRRDAAGASAGVGETGAGPARRHVILSFHLAFFGRQSRGPPWVCPRRDSRYIFMCAGVESGRPRIDSPNLRNPKVAEGRATSTTATVKALCSATAVKVWGSAHHSTARTAQHSSVPRISGDHFGLLTVYRKYILPAGTPGGDGCGGGGVEAVRGRAVPPRFKIFSLPFDSRAAMLMLLHCLVKYSACHTSGYYVTAANKSWS